MRRLTVAAVITTAAILSPGWREQFAAGVEERCTRWLTILRCRGYTMETLRAGV
jgi:uncharacterized membrane protein YeiB